MQLFRTILLRLVLLTMLASAARTGWFAWRQGDAVRGVVAALAGAMTMFGIVMHLVVTRWNRRFESHVCPACGYDMRATPDRCPECAFEATDSEIPLPRWAEGNAMDVARAKHDKARRRVGDEATGRENPISP